MDFGSAAVVGAVILGLVSLARTLIDGTARERITAVVCLVIGIVAVLLVGASDFASEQVILNRPLDSMSIWSQLLVGILAASVASAGWQALTAVKNVGENQPPPAVPPAPPQP